MNLTYFQSDERYNYRIALMNAILKITGNEKKYSLKPIDINVSPKRGEVLLENGGIDFASFPTTKIREERFLPIKIPILAGILGFRIFFANKKIKKLDKIDIRKLSVGFNEQWSDYTILKNNQLNLMKTSAGYESLFKMLNLGRFMLFPRGINEVFIEYDKYKNEFPDIFVEQNYALYYDFPVYFFVSKRNVKLQSIIKTGLKKLKETKQFEAIFYEYHADLIKKANIKNRKIIYLKNILLPNNTPEIHQFWK